jgi:hypothetical protein
VIGGGAQAFQPIHVDDLAHMVVKILATAQLRARVITPVGPDVIALKNILFDLRRWLGFGTAPILRIPRPFVALIARFGDFAGGTINSTALRQLEFGNTGSFEDCVAATGIRPRAWKEILSENPAQTQDRWHARLYFLRPALRFVIAATWIVSGLVGLIQRAALVARYAALGVTLSMPAIWMICLLDLLIGLAVITRYRNRAATLLQLATVVAYTVALTVARPWLWLDPLGPLLKNVPFMLAILVLAAIEDER